MLLCYNETDHLPQVFHAKSNQVVFPLIKRNIFYPLLTSVLSRKVIFPTPYSTEKTIPYICNLLEKGKFNPVIDRKYVLEDISKAYEYVIKGQKTGNVLIKI